MKVYPTLETIELTENEGMVDIVIDGKIIDTFDKVEIEERESGTYVNCFNHSIKHDFYPCVDVFKVEL